MGQRSREREREREIGFKKLAHVIIDSGKSKICGQLAAWRPKEVSIFQFKFKGSLLIEIYLVGGSQ